MVGQAPSSYFIRPDARLAECPTPYMAADVTLKYCTRLAETSGRLFPLLIEKEYIQSQC